MDHRPVQLSVRTDHKKGAYMEAQRRRQREHQLKIISRIFKPVVHAKCVLATFAGMKLVLAVWR